MVLLKNIKIRKITKKGSKTENRWIRECEICGEKFLVSKARRDSARFCSYKCRGIAQRRKIWNIRPRTFVEFKCKNCGKTFKRQKRKYGTRTNQNEPQFCSKLCYTNFLRGKPSRSKVEVRKREREKRQGQCIICGFDRLVEIAHILPASLNGTYKSSNILFLCPNHHRLFDSNDLVKEEEKIIRKKVLKVLGNINPETAQTARFKKFLDHWCNEQIPIKGRRI